MSASTDAIVISVVGSRCRNPPFLKIGDDRQRHRRPRAALRRRLRARPPTPPPGTLPSLCEHAPHSADHADGLAEIDLRVPRRVRERHEHLPRPPLLLPDVVGDDGDAAGEPVLVSAARRPLRRVTLLLQLAFVVFQIRSMTPTNGSSFGRGGDPARRYPGGTECFRIFDTVLHRSRNAGLPPARSSRQRGTPAVPVHKAPQNTSPRLQLVASGAKWRNFTPRRPGDQTVSVDQFVSGIDNRFVCRRARVW